MATWWQPGQLLFVGFSGTRLPPDLAALLAAGRVGGVILFARNVGSPTQVRQLVREIHAAAPSEHPTLVAIDQEGGRVQRLKAPWTVWPPMERLGAVDDLELTGAVARALARELLDLGIGLDFAPVVDVHTNPLNPIIGDRAFGCEPELVGRHAAAFIAAMQEAGVAACAKHFPGHGDTETDSHLELPVLPHDLERLRRVELPPFAAAARAGVASVMTAHVLYPRLDAHHPATLAPEVLALLRHELGYDGVVFSDDLEMKAVAGRWAPRDLVQRGLEAGVDAFLVCSDPALRDEVLRRLERTSDAAVEAPLRRVIALKEGFARRAAAVPEEISEPPYPEHEALARRFVPPASSGPRGSRV